MPRPAPMSKERELDLVAQYQQGVSRNALALQFNASRPFVTACLRRHGVPCRNLKEACPGFPIRTDAFDSAETDEHAAYWVGFLMADGCISLNCGRGSPHIILVLGEQDKEHLESFRAFLHSTHAIQMTPTQKSYGGPTVRLDLTSSRLVTALARYGVVPRKTAVAEVRVLNQNRHFWRGVVDGDGSIHLSRRQGYKPRPVLQVVGSHNLMAQFADFALSVTGTKARPHRSKSIWGVSLYCSHALAMIKRLYNDCQIALPRKHKIALALTSPAAAPGL